MQIMMIHPLLKIFNSTFINMPSPSTISYMWNFGSLLGLIVMAQIMSGLMLTFHYTPDISLTFSSLIFSTRNIMDLWMMRWIHANGASLIFILIYLHMARNIYFSSFKKFATWNTGVMMFLVMMIIAFMGYVLPWGQMSYWGVTVITNLLTTLPYIGQTIVNWLWGDYSVNNSTLKRFYSLHFILPIILLMLIILHLLFLHQYGSSNPLGLQNYNDMIYFHPFFITKDLLGLMITFFLFIIMIFMNPLIFNDPENFIKANLMITPIHIQPEWYFLFAYAILRSIPSKVGGVIALSMSIMSLFFFPMSNKYTYMKFSFNKKFIFWSFMNTFIMLTWIGMNSTNYPFSSIGMIFSLIYFLLITLFLF